ncbi:MULTISPECIES: GMC family oxidoreductase [unclassified Oleiphilus]|jgi:choline dehydrogenase-like flavoprotein|nr:MULTISPECIES: choline dehydrogenase [unclassified Oleiphilus]
MSELIYDYIIVGAGSAGSVLANRLSENEKNSVLVLEAGPEDKSPMIKIPGAFAYFMYSKKYNWGYESEAVADIRKGQPMFCPRGKTLGGSSAINAMVYVRGDKSDYDHWEAQGNKGWKFDSMLPYFKKAETNERGCNDYHGSQGPLYVSNTQNTYPLNECFLKGSEQAGYPLNDDFNGPQFEGVGYYQFTIKNGERCGVSRAYLKPARTRKNLHIQCEALVNRIILEDKEAKGVVYSQREKEYTAHAKKEVILCGGAFNTPQTLMLSGIGDKKELEKVGIAVVHDLPGVGKNLQEHVDACVLVKSKKKDGFSITPSGLLKALPDAFNYFTAKKGNLANSITQSGGFLKSGPSVEVPDIQLHFVPLLFDDCGRDLGLLSQHGYSLHVCVLRPESRGQLSLKSLDPRDRIKIDFNFLSQEKDQKVLVDGIRVARKILASEAFDDHRGDEVHPGADITSDADILQACKDRLGLVYHPVGTCKMGNDDMSVVDDQLRVHGISKLRVVDASIMPTLISGNTNAPVIAIAEKASDLILSPSTMLN